MMTSRTAHPPGSAFLREMAENRQLYLMALPGLLFFLVFTYLPLYGLQLAFKYFNAAKGILGSPLVGLENFMSYFGTMYFARTTFNTLFLNSLFILTVQGFSLLLALLINEVRNRFLMRTYQSILFFPYFISWIIVSAITYNLFNEQSGAINGLLTAFGLQPVMWYYDGNLWVIILTVANLWKGMGFQTIIYLAAITAIDEQQYEAARIDGAGKIRTMWHITLPNLLPTVTIMLILSLGKIFYGNFDMIYALIRDNGQLLARTDVIDTFVYRTLAVTGDTGMAAAVGLYQSLLGFILVLLANRLSRRFSEGFGLY